MKDFLPTLDTHICHQCEEKHIARDNVFTDLSPEQHVTFEDVPYITCSESAES